MNGVRILAGLATFTLIYRYVAPVLITPAANWLGDRANAKKKERTAEAAAKKIALNSSDNKPKPDSKVETKTVVMNNNDDASKEHKFHVAA